MREVGGAGEKEENSGRFGVGFWKVAHPGLFRVTDFSILHISVHASCQLCSFVFLGVFLVARVVGRETFMGF